MDMAAEDFLLAVVLVIGFSRTRTRRRTRTMEQIFL